MIEKGSDWGSPGGPATGVPRFDDDRSLGVFLAELSQGNPLTTTQPTVALSKGDLARTLGMIEGRAARAQSHLVPVDAIEIILDDDQAEIALAHVEVGSLRWAKRTLLLMNAAYLGERNVAPRAHPGDGLIDTVDLRLSPRQRLEALSRMYSGTHVPHPDIVVGRVAVGEVRMTKRVRVRVDGARVGRARNIRFRAVPSVAVVAF